MKETFKFIKLIKVKRNNKNDKYIDTYIETYTKEIKLLQKELHKELIESIKTLEEWKWIQI